MVGPNGIKWISFLEIVSTFLFIEISYYFLILTFAGLVLLMTTIQTIPLQLQKYNFYFYILIGFLTAFPSIYYIIKSMKEIFSEANFDSPLAIVKVLIIFIFIFTVFCFGTTLWLIGLHLIFWTPIEYKLKELNTLDTKSESSYLQNKIPQENTLRYFSV